MAHRVGVAEIGFWPFWRWVVGEGYFIAIWLLIERLFELYIRCRGRSAPSQMSEHVIDFSSRIVRFGPRKLVIFVVFPSVEYLRGSGIMMRLSSSQSNSDRNFGKGCGTYRRLSQPLSSGWVSHAHACLGGKWGLGPVDWDELTEPS